MTPRGSHPPPLELWGGIECTVNRVGDRWFDQLRLSGHDVRPDDLAGFAALGIQAIRYPLLWERLAPRTLDEIDWRWADDRMSRLQGHALRPIVGLLHHGSGPAYTSLLDDGFAPGLARLAGAVARRYPWVTDFTPVNEPLTTARFSGLYGHWYPHHRSNHSYVRALLNQLKAVVLSMRAIREVTPAARLVQTEDCGRTFGTAGVCAQVRHESERRWLTWDLLSGRVDDRHPLHAFLVASGMTAADEALFIDRPCAPDIIGLNYYVTSDRYLDDDLARYPVECHGGNGRQQYADVPAVRARPEGIHGHEACLLDVWNRYHVPVALTEVHLGCTRDEQMRWFAEGWAAAQSARAQGADVRAVTAWALLGAYDWDSLVTRSEGRYEPGVFDLRSPTPRPTGLATLITALASGAAAPSHVVLNRPGWWRRPGRLLHHAGNPPEDDGRMAAPQIDTSPGLLILGATGTLGRAFQRICELRGLASKVVDRRECEITDLPHVVALLNRLQPWAVINATGYVRVDDAERDVEACRRANVAGPLNLAAACRAAGVPLVTFSSDLVFDGRASSAYTESTAPNPLNVYGATKADADRLLSEEFPEALIIRTSAFFGPWDQSNFATRLTAALERGACFQAPVDSTVSPTYVPHLVHAVLDLVLDGAQGLWHLANSGEATWYEFARTLATRQDLPLHLVVPVETDALWNPAVRPRYSALASCHGQLLPTLDEGIDEYLSDVVRAGGRKLESCASL